MMEKDFLPQELCSHFSCTMLIGFFEIVDRFAVGTPCFVKAWKTHSCQTPIHEGHKQSEQRLLVFVRLFQDLFYYMNVLCCRVPLSVNCLLWGLAFTQCLAYYVLYDIFKQLVGVEKQADGGVLGHFSPLS